MFSKNGKYIHIYYHMHAELHSGNALEFAINHLLRLQNNHMFDLLFSFSSCDRNELFTKLEALGNQEIIYVDNRELGQPPVYCYL